MKNFFLDDEETVSRWEYAAGFVGVFVLWYVVIAAALGLI